MDDKVFIFNYLQVTREVTKRIEDLTHQVHREILSRSVEQVKTLAPILICSMKIFIQLFIQGKSRPSRVLNLDFDYSVHDLCSRKKGQATRGDDEG